jgi:phenylacetate-CoA ligase
MRPPNAHSFPNSCREGWLHVNADWVILEPVDAHHRPTPPGEQSHTVLVTNLANRVQPILRYDLGDSVLRRPDPCPCGNPLPAIRVQGRTADLLTFPTPAAGTVTLTPLSIATRLDRLPGVALFQILQSAPAELTVRLQPTPSADPEQTWAQVHRELIDLLTRSGLAHVVVHRATDTPQPATGGKYRLVQPFTHAAR